MTRASRAPAVVEWLLRHVDLPGSSLESLGGDLIEEHRHGRSALWLWTQVGGAFAFGVCQEIRLHWVVAVSGTLTGFTSLWCFAALATGY